jgi:hypothetical protein
MPSLSEVGYSRDATTKAIQDYFSFLTMMYIPTSSILEPPKDGWPEITKESMSAFEKSDEVIELLKHLPYIEESSSPNWEVQAAPNCYLADYRSSSVASYLKDGRGEDLRVITEGLAAVGEGNVPAHVVGLTRGGRDDVSFLLDTKLGIIHWLDCPDNQKHRPSREQITDFVEDFAAEEELEWRRNAPAWPIVDFFEMLKDEFRGLFHVPFSAQKVYGAELESPAAAQSAIESVRKIYREYGWPDLPSYQKESCLQAVEKMLKEQYPELDGYA